MCLSTGPPSSLPLRCRRCTQGRWPGRRCPPGTLLPESRRLCRVLTWKVSVHMTAFIPPTEGVEDARQEDDQADYIHWELWHQQIKDSTVSLPFHWEPWHRRIKDSAVFLTWNVSVHMTTFIPPTDMSKMHTKKMTRQTMFTGNPDTSESQTLQCSYLKCICPHDCLHPTEVSRRLRPGKKRWPGRLYPPGTLTPVNQRLCVVLYLKGVCPHDRLHPSHWGVEDAHQEDH